MVTHFAVMQNTESKEYKFANNGELYAQMNLSSDLSEDTAQGRLILQTVNTAYIAPYNEETEPGGQTTVSI